MRPALLVPCVLALLACTRGTPAPAGKAVLADSLRGTVDVVGSEPATWVVLRVDGGTRDVALDGDAGVLRRLTGLEVTVWGERAAGGRFAVARVAVRSASGVTAVDGILAREGEGFALVTEDGRRLPIARLPETLRSAVGARVWLAGPLDRAPDSFGVIADPR
ncbi:MAG TPA: hypothetical protein VGB24_12890 [Longimicrobium sp.]|uniref:hypothetical protein n=1 Tax=Longimicrobium sp. TaxID=2029185 RepID=UPI002ED82AF3